ncbi:MAG: putative selenate reductase subunit YgfK [Spirochaetota bacterium]
MGDRMRPVPFGELIARIFMEYQADKSIFGIPEAQFFRKKNTNRIEIFGETCDTPVGPAAGPHTQLAQNIITAYLVGGRFFELKTVQKLDRLKIEKPCIDAEDEGFNTEWSTEFTLEQAYSEYVKAWIILHLMEEVFKFRRVSGERSFIFNMSVGYDLAGIQTAGMDTFINDMMDSSANRIFKSYLYNLESLIEEGAFIKGTGLESSAAFLKGLSARISPKICGSVTLSTMHGCPPEEIEAICMYMLTDKKLKTFVKLNPTLLGYEAVRVILDRLGFGYVELKEDSFLHDLQYPEAVAMLKRLTRAASARGINFGVKLTNTLGSVNNKGVLPGDQMYMSGRALFPLSITIASRLSAEFEGRLPVSYCGGVSSLNIERIFDCGLRPITMATELLKPGGYLRLRDAALKLEALSGWDRVKINGAKLKRLAEDALSMESTQKKWRGFDRVSIPETLPLFDCYAAPCVIACPIKQDVPGYIKLVGQKRYSEALKLIYAANALPAITGYICDHQCMYKCSRLDYEGAVKIREMKKIAALNGWKEFKSSLGAPVKKRAVKAAVIGAGPAGLAAAYFLAREGFDVTVFEKQKSAGGVVAHLLPRFRIPEEALLQDLSFIEAHGVEFKFGVKPDFRLSTLKSAGYKYICLAIGAEKGNELPLGGDNRNVIEALKFLSAFHQKSEAVSLGRRVGVVGGGNTAIDSARAALKVRGVEKVSVFYRRTEAEMPADREEYELARAEGVEFSFRLNPESFTSDGTLTLRVMKLAEADESGRRRPLPTDEVVEKQIDTLITAVGEQVDLDALKACGLEPGEKGLKGADPSDPATTVENVFLIGDALTGPSTVVQCIALAGKAAAAICRKEDSAWKPEESPLSPAGCSPLEDIFQKKAGLRASIAPTGTEEAFALNEAARCLECNYVCNKCVEVCPNRANIALPVAGLGGFRDAFQIVHLDAYCNECGNCARFCPYDGRPFTDKFTIFNLPEDFKESENNGFLVTGNEIKLRLKGKLFIFTLDKEGNLRGAEGGGRDENLSKALKIIGHVVKRYSRLLGPVEN